MLRFGVPCRRWSTSFRRRLLPADPDAARCHVGRVDVVEQRYQHVLEVLNDGATVTDVRARRAARQHGVQTVEVTCGAGGRSSPWCARCDPRSPASAREAERWPARADRLLVCRAGTTYVGA